MDDIVVFLIVAAGLAVVEQGAAAMVRLWYAGRHADEVRQRVEVLGREGRVDEALRIAQVLPGSVSTVVHAGLSAADEAEAERAMRAAAAAELRRLGTERRIVDWAGVAAVVIPLAFGAWLLYEGRFEDEVEGWLMLLALGLAVAIVAVLIRFWLLSRVRRHAADMEKGAAVVYNTAR